ncbi:MAG: hypothetical protein Q4A74_02925 [Cardiobacteriaceae bacterium]|nr:hypothetical protein [Cardiobacteriaceae bacterium]
MDTQTTITTETRGFVGTLAAIWNASFGLIVGPKGFFGPGFWADFKEGWNADQAQPHVASQEEQDFYFVQNNFDTKEDTYINNNNDDDDLHPLDYLGYNYNYLNYYKRK